VTPRAAAAPARSIALSNGRSPLEIALPLARRPGMFPCMYQCTTPPIALRTNKRILREAYWFMKMWRAESKGSRPHVRVKFLGRKQRVFIDDFHYHIEVKGLENMVGRYRLFPCVRELVKHSTDIPVETSDGNLMLEGMTPDGEKFRVIVRPEKRGGCLQSFYPS